MLRASMSVRVSRNVTEEEGEWEYASYHPGSKPGSEEAHVEDGLLYQPLSTWVPYGVGLGQRQIF
jgi:hypothetical protein